jgi:hypothetical protein
MKEYILDEILKSIDLGFICICNLFTYMVIKNLEVFFTLKYTPLKIKRIITLIVGIFFGILIYNIKDIDLCTLIYSFVFSLFSFDYIFKPILKRFKTLDYKKDKISN